MKFSILKGPFIKSKNNTNKIMNNLLVALLPIIIFSFYKNGIIPYQNNKVDLYGMFYPLIFIFIGTITSYITELLYAYIFKKLKKQELKNYMKNSYSIIPGLFVSLVLPLNTPLEILVMASIIAIIFGKMLYGGFGKNIFNPALIGCLFVLSMYSQIINLNGGYINKYELDTIGSATPLTNVKLTDSIGTYDTLVKPYGNLKDFLFGFIPGSTGETCSILIILAFFYLVYKRVIKWKIPVIYVATVFVMTYIIGSINGLGIWYPIFNVLSGGLLFGAVFMATDPVTSPITCVGQIIYAMSLGILTVIFRYQTSAPEGVLTSILTMNMFVMLLDRLGSSNKYAIKKIIIPLIILSILIISISINIGNKYNKKGTDSNFKILEKTNDYYIVTEKGNGGPIKAKLYINNKEITKIEILENNETPSYYSLVEKNNYINKLINNQMDIENIDTVSGATISSTALKKMVTNVLDDMEG